MWNPCTLIKIKEHTQTKTGDFKNDPWILEFLENRNLGILWNP